MTDAFVVDILRSAFFLILQIVGPILLISLIVGLIISIFQATTQIQEQTLTFAPKLFAILLIIIMVGPFMLNSMVEFTKEIFDYIQKMNF